MKTENVKGDTGRLRLPVSQQKPSTPNSNRRWVNNPSDSRYKKLSDDTIDYQRFRDFKHFYTEMEMTPREAQNFLLQQCRDKGLI